MINFLNVWILFVDKKKPQKLFQYNCSAFNVVATLLVLWKDNMHMKTSR